MTNKRRLTSLDLNVARLRNRWQVSSRSTDYMESSNNLKADRYYQLTHIPVHNPSQQEVEATDSSGSKHTEEWSTPYEIGLGIH